VQGAEQDPTPNNNRASVRIAVKAKPPPPPPPGCDDRRSFVFEFPQDKQDSHSDGAVDVDEGRVITVKVYIDGEHVETFRGRNRHRVHIQHPPKKGTHHVKVVGFYNNGFKVILRRTYNGCTNGPTSMQVFRPRPRDDKP